MSCMLGIVTFFCAPLPVEAKASKAAANAKPVTDGTSDPAIPYAVTLTPTKQADLDAAISASSQLKSLQTSHTVGAYALAGRIRSDYDRVNSALESQGYYAGSVKISVKAGAQTVDGKDPSLPDILKALGKGQKVTITISATLGPRFSLGTVALTTPPQEAPATSIPAPSPATPAATAPAMKQSSAKAPVAKTSVKTATGEKTAPAAPPAATVAATSEQAIAQAQPVSLLPAERKAFGLSSGQPAVAADVLAAQNGLLSQLQEEGYATASVSTPLAYLKPQTHTLDIVFRVTRGPRVVIGPVAMTGLKQTNQSYLMNRLELKEGELYRPSRIEAARQDLASTGVFASVQVRNAPPIITLPPGKTLMPGILQAMPIEFSFKEAKRRTLSAEVGYSTDLGGRVGVSWTHHNLLGNAEQLRLTALITGLGGSAQQGLGYDVYADFMKPDFLSKGQNLSVRLEGIRQLLYSYHQTAIIGRAGLNRHVGKYWNISGGVMGEQEQIQQFGDTRSYFIVSAPLNATFDSTQLSNPIDPATHGLRASLSVTPSESLESGSSFFTLLSAQVSTYFDLKHLGISRPGRSIIAVRGIVGSVQGASTYQIPPDQRLYAGGPATVRGFRYQGVGPQYGNTKYGIGGTSMDAGSVEFRQRLPMNLGFAGFVDAGQVGTGSRPGQGKLRVGYGGGVRYFTPIGPIRVDVALPMNRPAYGDKWELYFGLGETF
ncbi:BamA/TamA family outer membrane protein [Gluconobacter sp. Dm-62]|uniref:autotransporter assembly complex protein TamA n=1 Tax=Gluconobacter sp. Dm-62 TaxID=2799804 RepID=UPI001B8D2FD8|nr:BamA/TamA family outer membrane protein [Gluconobacter sp. Dm-62]